MEGRLPEPMSCEGNLHENFKIFYQSFDTYLMATEKDTKPDKVKIALFLNLVGREGVEIYNILKIAEKNKFDSVIAEFKKYCAPRTNKTYERFVFNNRNQGTEEPFDHFYGHIKKLIQSCEYDTQEDSILVDRIILGTNDPKVQEKLLSIQNLSLQRATETCRNAELTNKQLETVRNKEEASIDALKTRRKHEKTKFVCRKCKGQHGFAECPAFGKKCFKCGKENHFSSACQMGKSGKYQEGQVKKVREVVRKDLESSEDELYVHSLKMVHEATRKSQTVWTEIIRVHDKDINFKIDTGSEVNILPKNIFQNFCINNKSHMVKKCNTVLEAYGGAKLNSIGKINLQCVWSNKVFSVDFLIVDLNVKPIIGLPTCYTFGLVKKCEDVDSVSLNDKEIFIQKNNDVFEGLGTFSDVCKIQLKKHSKPVARNARRIPMVIKNKLREKLDKLENENIIARVNEASEWVNNLVIVEKPDNSLRLCLDPRDLNKCIEREYFEIPSLEEICSKLSGKKYFSVIDFKDGFYQVKLDDASSVLTTFATPFGCYKFLRLPFGLNIAPEYFQKANFKNFGDIENLIIYFDDLLIASDTLEEHDNTLKKVLERARERGVKFNKNKFQFRQTEVKYIGHIFNDKGMRIDDEKLKAINDLKPPSNKKELQRLLGLINYVRKFIPKLGEIADPLCQLLRKDIIYQWLGIHDKALETIKQELGKNLTLKHFDFEKEITIQTDASENGLGCCLMQNGRPVAYASRGLSDTEKSYAVIEKEMLGIVYACQKFHNFVYGRTIKIITDHKPNVSVMNKQITSVNSARLQRLRLRLLKYDVQVQYLPGKYLYIADYLSRNVSGEKIEQDDDMKEIVHSVEKYLRMSESRKEEFRKETVKDMVLSKVIEHCKNGWKKQKYEGELGVFYNIRHDLQVLDDLIFFNDRVVVPATLRKNMLKMLHEGHFGITRTRDRARGVLFWPGMSADVEREVQLCRTCEKYRYANIKEPLMSHDIPELPFQKIGGDIMEYGGRSYLIVADYLTKWLEIVPLKSKQSSDVIDAFKQIFATHGVPDKVVADNMPFNSYECKGFAKEFDFKFETSSPRYPRSNGLAERFVQTAKNIIRKSDDMWVALMEYRSTPITGLKRSPAELLFSRKLKTKLPVVEKQKIKIKEFKQSLESRNESYKEYYDRHTKLRQGFQDGDTIVYRDNNRWRPAIITAKHESPRSYLIDNGINILRRNSNHLRKSVIKHNLRENDDHDSNITELLNNDEVSRDKPRCSFNSDSPEPRMTMTGSPYVNSNEFGAQNSKRPTRTIKKPSKLSEYIVY